MALVNGLLPPDEVDFVLQDDNVVQLHDLNGSKMLGRLRLWAGLVTR